MPRAKKMVIECPKCTYARVVTRGDCLPDDSTFQHCPKCGEMMIGSDKSVDEVSSIVDDFLGLFRRKKR